MRDFRVFTSGADRARSDLGNGNDGGYGQSGKDFGKLPRAKARSFQQP